MTSDTLNPVQLNHVAGTRHVTCCVLRQAASRDDCSRPGGREATPFDIPPLFLVFVVVVVAAAAAAVVVPFRLLKWRPYL